MAGRPEANIDWDKVDRLLEAGCPTTEIAAHFGIHSDTFYKRCKTDHKINYSEYSQQKKAKGASLLRAAQYKNAMEGNTTMQVWLGKQRLDQRDKPKDEENSALPNMVDYENQKMLIQALKEKINQLEKNHFE